MARSTYFDLGRSADACPGSESGYAQRFQCGNIVKRRIWTRMILGPFGPDTDIRRYGLRLCERGGKNAKKRAAVAVARKLAVLLHRLWVSGEVYEPLRPGMSATMTPAAAA